MIPGRNQHDVVTERILCTHTKPGKAEELTGHLLRGGVGDNVRKRHEARFASL